MITKLFLGLLNNYFYEIFEELKDAIEIFYLMFAVGLLIFKKLKAFRFASLVVVSSRSFLLIDISLNSISIS